VGRAGGSGGTYLFAGLHGLDLPLLSVLVVILKVEGDIQALALRGREGGREGGRERENR
jgi:hypothetical protein